MHERTFTNVSTVQGIDQVGLRTHHNGYWLSESLLEFIGIVLELFTLWVHVSNIIYHHSAISPSLQGVALPTHWDFSWEKALMLPGACGIAEMGVLSFFLSMGERGGEGGGALVSRDAVLVLVPDKKGMRAGIEDWYSTMGAQIRTDLLQYRHRYTS